MACSSRTGWRVWTRGKATNCLKRAGERGAEAGIARERSSGGTVTECVRDALGEDRGSNEDGGDGSSTTGDPERGDRRRRRLWDNRGRIWRIHCGFSGFWWEGQASRVGSRGKERGAACRGKEKGEQGENAVSELYFGC